MQKELWTLVAQIIGCFWRCVRLAEYWLDLAQRQSLCDRSSCVRCGRRPYSTEVRCYLLLYHRFNVMKAKASRVWNTNTPYQTLCHGQNPTVFSVDNVKSKELPETSMPTVKMNEQINMELLEWVANERSPGLGQWKMAHLINQGKQTDNFEHLPFELRQLLTRTVPQCKLFNAALSLIEINATTSAGTLIKRHTGIANVKWRHHIPIYVNERLAPFLCLEVNAKCQTWQSAFTMDDSFEHGVTLRDGAPRRGERLVLIMDAWNEDLSSQERDEISFVTEHIL